MSSSNRCFSAVRPSPLGEPDRGIAAEEHVPDGTGQREARPGADPGEPAGFADEPLRRLDELPAPFPVGPDNPPAAAGEQQIRHVEIRL